MLAMWKTEEERDADARNPGGDAVRHRRFPLFARLLFFFPIAGLLLTTGCRRDMQDQPKMKPFRTSTFFGDGLSARPPVEGTIPRGYLRADTGFFTGKKTRMPAGATPGGPQPTASAPGGATQVAAAYPDDIEVLPLPVTDETLKRGQERYNIFCSVCHGLTGYGDGMIVRRGFRRAGSFHDDRVRTAPVGHYFDAITNGWGAMPSYAPQIPVQDRWAIIAYIKALQLSQENPKAQATVPAQPAATPANATPANGGPPR
jgi:mono/diheme cytochrome c family protein